MPPRQTTYELLREALPASGLIAIINFIIINLEYYECFLKTTNLHAWTVIWVAAFLISLSCPIKHGPLMVAGTGSARTMIMLWELYSLVGVETCDETVSVVDLVIGGALSAVACGGSFYVASHYCSDVPVHSSENGGRDDKEKVACGPQIFEI